MTGGPRYFNHDYVERTQLRDGTPVVVRLVRPADAELLRRGFERLSHDSRYARFFVPKSRLTDDELEYLTGIDQENHFAIGAVRDGDPTAAAGLGIARFIRLGDPEMAEAAIAVADDSQGHGLGRLLFLRLCAAARERGITTFRCEILAANTTMKNLLCSIAHDRRHTLEGPVLAIELVVPDISPTAPITGEAPAGSSYDVLRAAAEQTIAVSPLIRKRP